jgi:hypothetical protein
MKLSDALRLLADRIDAAAASGNSMALNDAIAELLAICGNLVTKRAAAGVGQMVQDTLMSGLDEFVRKLKG